MADKITISAPFSQDSRSLGRIGRVGENISRQILFDCTSVLADRPNANIVCVIQRTGDKQPYAAQLTRVGETNSYKLVLTSTEVAAAGSVRFELRMVDGEEILKAAIYTGTVEASMSGLTDKPGEPLPDALNRLEAAIAEVGKYADLKQQLDDVSAAGLSAADATTDQVPTADGEGGWAWKAQKGGSTVELDTTLTTAGKAADAKAVGDYIAKLEERIAKLEAGGITVTTADQLVSAVPLTVWKFNLIATTADTSYTSTAEAAAGFDDASWRTVSVPHDWSVGLDFNASSPATYEGGYLDGGDAWYRTTVSVDKQSGRRYVLCFDGVYMESTVYVNGQQVHKNYYGYNPFAVDATEQLVSGTNTIAVFVRNEQPSSRWYSGSGLIRPVELVTLLDDQIRMENICVTTPKLDSDLTNGETVVSFDAVNKTGAEASATFTVDLYDPSGAKVGTADATATIAAGATQNVSVTVALANPTLWGIGAGNLYEAQVSAKVGNQIQRAKRVPYGYRSIRFDKDTGFYLNGAHTKLKGVCVHHDGGCIGAAENRSAIERQVDILTAMGCNAIRLTHNPFGLDVCQRKGVLLVEELFDGWTKSKKQKDFGRYFTDHYAEVVTSTIHRDWNNPAVIMWSLGNEVRTNLTLGDYSSSEIVSVCTMVNSAVKALDTTRPTTMGNNAPGGNLASLMSIVDVVGINYNGNNQTYQTDRPIYGSETTSALASRGVYATDSANMAYPSYDNKAVSWGNTAAETVNAYLNSTRSCGHFVWTGFDYIGEPTEWNKYPAKSSYFGIVDTCGFPKDIYFMYQSMWASAPMVHILPHWTHESGNIDVWLYSNCASVELFLNGTSLGKKTLSQRGTKNQYAYTVAYTAGTLVANGYDANNKLVAQDIQYTSADPAKLALSSDKTAVGITSDDLVYVTCDVVDKNGTLCPTAANKVTFAVTGGTIVGTDNGHGANVEKFSGSSHSAFSGKCLCVVKHDGASGTMKITATADGLTAGTISVTKGDTTIKAATPAASFVDATNPPMRDVSEPEEDAPTISAVSVNKTTATLNEEITFTLTVANATSIRVYIDGSASGTISDVTDGAVTYKHTFTTLGSGTRTVAFEPCRGDVVGAITAAKVITLTIPATNISLSASTLSLEQGDTAALTATVTPTNSTDSVVWSSSPSGIVSISNNTVTALAAGNTTITATAGSKSATCAVTVTKAVPKLLYELPSVTTFDGATDTVIDTDIKLFENVSSKQSYTILCDVDCSEIWNIDDRFVLAHCMEESGSYPGLTVSIVYGSKNDDDGSSVNQPRLQLSLYGSRATIKNACNTAGRVRFAIVIDGGTYTVVPTGIGTGADYNGANTTIKSYTANVAKTLILGGYQTSDGTHGRFFKGKVHDFKVYKGAYSETECETWVNTIPTVPATGITVSPNTLSMTVNDTATLSATVTPSGCTDTVTWSVSPSGIVSVSDGNVTALAAGNATITATAGAYSATCAVTVAASGEKTTLYELPGETVFTAGTDTIIDTGLKLFADISTKPKYTFLFDVTGGQNMTTNNSTGETCVLAHCMEESNPWPGFVLHVCGNYFVMQANMYGSKFEFADNMKGQNLRCALVVDGANWYYASNAGSGESTAISNYTAAVAKSLIIGGYQQSDGTHGRFFDGTLHSFKVLQGAYSMEECQAWVEETT